MRTYLRTGPNTGVSFRAGPISVILFVIWLELMFVAWLALMAWRGLLLCYQGGRYCWRWWRAR